MLEEGEFPERKAFLRSFIEKIQVDKDQVKVIHKLPPPNGKDRVAVLPIDTLGGPQGTVTELLFEKKGLIPSIQQLLVSSS
jgi:hypothetical protein